MTFVVVVVSLISLGGFFIGIYMFRYTPAHKNLGRWLSLSFLSVLLLLLFNGQTMIVMVWRSLRTAYTSVFIGTVDQKDLERAHGDVFDWRRKHQWYMASVEEVRSPTEVSVLFTQDVFAIDVVLLGLSGGQTPPERLEAMDVLKSTLQKGDYISLLLPGGLDIVASSADQAHASEKRKYIAVIFKDGECLNLELLKTGKFQAVSLNLQGLLTDAQSPVRFIGMETWVPLLKPLFYAKSELYRRKSLEHLDYLRRRKMALAAEGQL